MPLIQFDSLQAFCDDLPARDRDDDSRSRWSGGLSYSECKRDLWAGDEHSLAESDKLLSQVEGDGIALEIPVWEKSLAGAFPCIPSFIAGAPDSMYHLDKTRAESAPIKIYADLFISAAFSADDCIKRGVTILALVRKLQAIRPVELFVLMSSSMTSSWDTKKKREVFSPVIRIDTSPLDLATLSFLFGHPGFIRKLTFNWHWSKGVPSEIPFFEISEKDIPEMGPDDLLLKNAIFTRDVLNDPLKFINDQVQRFAQNVIE